ncbi:MAG: 3-deoxy-manno-octulosonate cytidylyltransferase [Parcubacteria group bacterium GW2011_GWB2_40_8]|nr:MAG: 3-deoxy-manno-octulosonate cytidylyltransferase [Parcubacteria group bacterium GW2011_GWB2_40_8]OHE40293.1 MAG: hypothetical protein A2102_02910 [Tenericutes bacterium GWF2_38_8]
MRTGLIIIGHIGSTRLEKKMLLPLGTETFIEQVFNEAMKKWNGPIIFATSSDAEDDILADMAANKKIDVVRGHSTDILKRYLKAVNEHALEAVVTWDGDDLFVDKQCLTLTKELLEKGNGFVKPKDLPYGTFSYGVSAAAIRTMAAFDSRKDTDGWQNYITQIPSVKVAEYEIKKYAPLSRLRLTLDYPEDYSLIQKVFEFLEKNQTINTLDGIKEFSEQFPRECLINQNRVEEYQKRWEQKYKENFLDENKK